MGTHTKAWRGTEMPVGVAAHELEGPAVPEKDKKWRAWSHGENVGKRDTGIVSSESENRGSFSTSL